TPAGLTTLNARRKYVVMNLLLALEPKLTMVASSPSPYPSCAGPLFQAPSLNPVACQAVPWFVPLSRYFQVSCCGMKVSDVWASVVAGAMFEKAESLPEFVARMR